MSVFSTKLIIKTFKNPQCDHPDNINWHGAYACFYVYLQISMLRIGKPYWRAIYEERGLFFHTQKPSYPRYSLLIVPCDYFGKNILFVDLWKN